jgi:hypothetical protein
VCADRPACPLTHLANPLTLRPRARSQGWLLAGFFFLSCELLSLSLQQMYNFASFAGIKIRGALLAAVYHKAVYLENVGDSIGDVVR